VSDVDPVIERLDKLIALVSLAFAEPIGRARDAVRSNPAIAAILDASSEGWTPAAVVRDRAKAAGAAESTTRKYVADLVAAGALRYRGATSTREYRSTGVY
jgi:hypothetical protein